ncbi:hypothetical protein RvY_15808 [Ramazzottius varieornatus]|uniref:Major facilitator superfamily (MFS) profile domain-containing protein n=1 Tax=Ramazzottius varieornatus TaxID=947166 RepID=A0A1D1VW90_RAMVA|nr:hypothetical protein RvY_15808 [Ramazzottius varieornatus]
MSAHLISAPSKFLTSNPLAIMDMTVIEMNRLRFLRAIRIPGTNWIPSRYAMSALCFFGFFNLYALRVNMSVGIVAMVNNTRPAVPVVSPALIANSSDALNFTPAVVSVNQDIVCPYPNISSSDRRRQQGRFNWSNQVQGVILGSFFYGYITTQLIGGYICSRFGAKQPFGLSIFLSAILSFFIPLAAEYHYGAVIGIRVLQGITEGFSYPAMHTLLGRWAPPNERSRIAAISYAGVQVGTVVTMLLSGVLAEQLGWESVFHFFGALGIIWYIVWVLYASSSPEEHPRISEAERRMILNAIGATAGRSPPIPWRKILCSVPVWTVCVGAFGHNWGFYTLLTNIPSYLSKVLHFRIQSNGFISALPYITTVCFAIPTGYVVDVLRRRKLVTTTWARRWCHLIGQVLPSMCLILLGFVGCDLYSAVALLTLAVGLDGIAASGYQFNHVDISPTYAGILMGLSNTVSSVPGMIGPYIVGVITNGPSGNTVAAWRLVFYITAAVSVSCAIFFFIFASGELGDWEIVRPDESNETKKLSGNRDPSPTPSPAQDSQTQEEELEGVTYGKVRYRAKSIQLHPSSTTMTLAEQP